MLDAWSLIRFVHVAGAALWVGGQLTLTFVVLPLARRALSDEARATVLPAVGRRFARITVAYGDPTRIDAGSPREAAEAVPAFEQLMAEASRLASTKRLRVRSTVDTLL